MSSSKRSNKHKRNGRRHDVGWSCNDTILGDDKNSLLKSEIKQLLFTRGATKEQLCSMKKSDLITYLKNDYTVDLEGPLQRLVTEQLLIELKLRELSTSCARDTVLIERLKRKKVYYKSFILFLYKNYSFRLFFDCILFWIRNHNERK